MDKKNEKKFSKENIKNKLILKKHAYKFQHDEYEPKPLNWKKIIISLSVVITIVTTIVLVWGLAFGGFAYKKYKNTAQSFYQQIFQAESKDKAEENLDNFNILDEDGFKNRLTDMIEHIYDENQMTYTDPDNSNNNIEKYSYKDSKRELSNLRKISNSEYIFQFLDDDSFKQKEPSLDHPWNNYLSRVVLVRIFDNKITGVAFFATLNASNAGQPYDYLGKLDKHWGAE